MAFMEWAGEDLTESELKSTECWKKVDPSCVETKFSKQVHVVTWELGNISDKLGDLAKEKFQAKY